MSVSVLETLVEVALDEDGSKDAINIGLFPVAGTPRREQ